MITCPKCQHTRSSDDDPLIPDYQCPACGVVYAKVMPKNGRISQRIMENIKASSKPGNRSPAVFEANEKPPALASPKRIDSQPVVIKKNSQIQFGKILASVSLFLFKTLFGLLNLLLGKTPKKPHRTQHTKADNLQENSEKTYAIRYQDSAGVITDRKITIHEVEKRGKRIYFEAYCHLRNEDRTFAADNIVGEMQDVETGKNYLPIELFNPDPEWALVDKDAWEDLSDGYCNIYPVNARLKFDYIDSEGRKTSRTVDIKKMADRIDGARVWGHCFMRDANRVFRTQNMRNCINVETGELISDVFQYLHDSYQKSPIYALESLMEKEQAAMDVLFFIAKADGSIRAKELEHIARYCKEISHDRRITETMVKNLFMESMPPTATLFTQTVKKLVPRDAEFKEKLIDTAKAIVATQKTVHPVEKFALDLLQSTLMPGSKN